MGPPAERFPLAGGSGSFAMPVSSRCAPRSRSSRNVSCSAKGACWPPRKAESRIKSWFNYHTSIPLGAALFRRSLSRSFIRVYARERSPLQAVLRGTASGERPYPPLSGYRPTPIRVPRLNPPGRASGPCPAGAPVWTFARRSGSVSWEGRHLCDGGWRSGSRGVPVPGHVAGGLSDDASQSSQCLFPRADAVCGG